MRLLRGKPTKRRRLDLSQYRGQCVIQIGVGELPSVMLGGYHEGGILPDIAERRPNLYFDVALLVSFDCLALPLVRAIGADRFVYGTDLYSWPLQTMPYGNLLANILETDLSDEEKIAILSGNLKKLLKLSHIG